MVSSMARLLTLGCTYDGHLNGKVTDPGMNDGYPYGKVTDPWMNDGHLY